MMKKIFIIAILFLAVSAIGMRLGKLYSQEEVNTKEISTKLKNILENQEKILKMLDEIKKELAIVKVRATR